MNQDSITDLDDLIIQQEQDTRRKKQDVLVNSAIVVGQQQTASLAPTVDSDLFSISKVQYNRNGSSKILQIVVRNNIMMIALNNNHIQKIELERPERIDDFEVSKNENDLVYRLFLDPTGMHLLVSMISGDFFYLNFMHLKKFKQISKIKHSIDSCSFVYSMETLMIHNKSTGPILLGTKEGLLFALEIESVEDTFYQKKEEKYFKQVYGIKHSSINGIFSFFSSDTKRLFVILTTYNRIYQMNALVSNTNLDLNSLESFFQLYKSNPTYQELPGDLPASLVSELHVLMRDSSVPSIFAWSTAAGIYYGEFSNLESFSEKDSSFIDNTQLLPYPLDSELVSSKVSPKKSVISLVNFALSNFHFILLHTDRIRIINRLNDEIVHEEQLPLSEEPDSSSFLVIKDDINSTFWFYNNNSIFEILMTNEDLNIYKIYLNRNQFEQALEYAKQDEQKEVVHKAMGNFYFDERRYLLAATYYSKTTLISMESVILKFIGEQGDNIKNDFDTKSERDEVMKIDALVVYLANKFSTFPENKKTQKTMVASLILELELSKKYHTQRSSEKKDEQLMVQIMKIENVLEEYKKNLDFGTTVKMLKEFGCIDEMLTYLMLTGNYEKVLYHYIQRKEYKKAVGVLEKAVLPKLYYKYSSILIEHVPVELVDLWISFAQNLNSNELIPSMLKYRHNVKEKHQVKRYLEYVVNSNMNNLLDTNLVLAEEYAVCNYLMNLYIATNDPNLSKLVKHPNVDLYYGLRLSIKLKNINSSILIYGELGLFEEAVDLALSSNDIELAKIYANKMVDFVLKKKLWMQIIEFELKNHCNSDGRYQTERAVGRILTSLNQLNGLISIEDVLNVISVSNSSGLLVDDFKDEIIKCLQKYKEQLTILKQEMQSAKQGSEELREMIERLKFRYVVVSCSTKCSVCSGNLNYWAMDKNKQDTETKFLVYPCGHAFHSKCCKDYCNKTYGSDYILDCPYCGIKMIKSIDIPFVEQEEEGWSIRNNLGKELEWLETESNLAKAKWSKKIPKSSPELAEESEFSDDFLQDFKFQTPKNIRKNRQDKSTTKKSLPKVQRAKVSESSAVIDVIELDAGTSPKSLNEEALLTPKILINQSQIIKSKDELKTPFSVTRNYSHRLKNLLEEKKELADKILDLMDANGDYYELSSRRREVLKSIEELKTKREDCVDQDYQNRSQQILNDNVGDENLNDEIDLIHDEDVIEEVLIRASDVENSEDSEQDCPLTQKIPTINDTFPLSVADPIVLSSDNQIQCLEAKTYYWTSEVYDVLQNVFKLKRFRQNQLETINAALSGKDCFVLMPTGGGKSLCYQLPAIISNGTTSGLTVVISPLLSLIQDQITNLRNKGIEADWLGGTMDTEEKREIFGKLNQILQGGNQLKLLYLTPEMINKSPKVQAILERLYKEKKLARFVVDEAHCLSQWGHDFRPDYKDLKSLRQKFNSVPIMALTATANEKVKLDVKLNLNIQGCEEFVMSFNRKNLKYYVLPKTKKIDQEIVDLIKSKWKGKSGIIYCTSKKSCEDVAETLRKTYHINAMYYHAGMSKNDRVNVQDSWGNNKITVIVATVAFGMGIDKPDVRFVIHYSLPQSLEGYYQETGRAGRDGLESCCILFYSYRDKSIIEFLIDKGEGHKEQKERQHDNLRQMLMFCENKTECRRVQLLAYFGEKFNSELCNGSCDVCQKTSSGNIKISRKNFGQDAKFALEVVSHLNERNEKATLNFCVDLFRGSKRQKILEGGYDREIFFGKGEKYAKHEVEKLYRSLVLHEFIKEECSPNASGFVSAYVKLTRKGFQAMSNTNFEFWVSFDESQSEKEKKTKGKKKTVERKETKTMGEDYYNEFSAEDENVSMSYDENNANQSNTIPRSKSKELESICSECFKELRELRSDLVFKKGLSSSASVYDDSTLLKLSDSLPADEGEYLDIAPDEQKFARYGMAFLRIIEKYRAKIDPSKDQEEDSNVEDLTTSKYFPAKKKRKFIPKKTFKNFKRNGKRK